jgi:predicted MPP superfamily phosphohydrolase
MFQLYHWLVFLYVALRFVLPLPIGKIAKTVIIALLLPLSQHHQLYRLCFGSMFSPEIPRPFVILIGWGYGLLVLLFILSVSMDLVFGLIAVIRRRALTPIGKHRCRYVVAGLALSVATFGVWQAVRVPDVRKMDLPIRDLPHELDGVRLVQLTDLHLSRMFEAPWAQAVVARTNALNPDLVFITGDIIDGTPNARRADVEPLRNLTAKHGVIAIPGNHEYYFGLNDWMKVFEDLGLRMLVNEHIVVTVNGRELVVAGVADAAARNFGFDGPRVDVALDGRPQHALTILLSHRPAGAHTNAQAGADVQLSGHTHGGMIRGFDRAVANANEGFVSGLYQVGAMQLYVSNGTGLWNGFPIRLGVPSEIVEFTLRRSL